MWIDRRFLRGILCIVLSLISISVAGSSDSVFPDKYAAIVVDAHSKQVLFEEKADMRRYPASLTKMMTLYLLFDGIRSGRISRKTLIPISLYASSRPPTKIGLRVGQRISIELAAKALITRSANDVAVAISEYLGGSERRFSRMMNRKARALGMINTHFANASGLPNSKNYSTARDIAILSIALREDFPQEYKLFKITSFMFHGKNVEGHNTLLKSMKGVDGIKTGYTRMSGFNLASSRSYGKKRIVAIVMGARSAALRDAYMANLLVDYMSEGFQREKGFIVPALMRGEVPIPFLKDFDKNAVLMKSVNQDIPIPLRKASLLGSDRAYDSALLRDLAAHGLLKRCVINVPIPVNKQYRS
ncbi:MAG: D-alanyl-D-alanine carboxypeptidase [Candidatus Tokpelaia sp. JSC161]|nr:MAG: D-alanyl-D-alanine carboxypeptidase [Candidatus Tokpelaia sp. JSC161]